MLRHCGITGYAIKHALMRLPINHRPVLLLILNHNKRRLEALSAALQALTRLRTDPLKLRALITIHVADTEKHVGH